MPTVGRLWFDEENGFPSRNRMVEGENKRELERKWKEIILRGESDGERCGRGRYL